MAVAMVAGTAPLPNSALAQPVVIAPFSFPAIAAAGVTLLGEAPDGAGVATLGAVALVGAVAGVDTEVVTKAKNANCALG